jgi:HD-GYP domain-containing protein (c-di-GMP phosphodiesterase class II)
VSGVTVAEQFLEFFEQIADQSVSGVSCHVLRKCRDLTGAEAGTIFILRGTGRHRQLEAVSVQNDLVPMSNATFVVPLKVTSIAGFVADSGETVYIDDAYRISPDRPFHFNSSFDDKTGFRTRSILCFALKGFRERPIGVVQLINCRDPATGAARPFAPEHGRMVAPVNLIVGRVLERTVALEKITATNTRLRERNDALRRQRERIAELQKETEAAFMTSVQMLARAAELHDQDTGNHILRVNEYSYALAQWAGRPKTFCNEIRYSAALHDVGKMSINQAVLHKKGRLDAIEMDEMRRHSNYGYEILRASPYLKMAADIAHCHHETWTGTGYPRKIKGEDIPIAARIVAIADVYDALRAKRPYKEPFTHGEAVHIMLHGDDRIDPAAHFDPRLLALFASHHQEFDRIWCDLAESETGDATVPAALVPAG